MLESYLKYPVGKDTLVRTYVRTYSMQAYEYKAARKEKCVRDR